MSTLNTTQIQTLKNTLLQREKQLLQELDTAHQEKALQEQALEDLPPEPDANQSRDTSDREVRHAERVRDQHELQDVRGALQRMEEGSFGECIDCGKDVAPARLLAFPSAKRCIQCQTLYETKKQRLF